MTELDIERPDELLRYLRTSGRIEPLERPLVTTLSGGVSNRTVLLERPSGEEWVLKQALSKLRVQADWFCSPERIHREAVALIWLARLAPEGTITPLVFEDRDRHVLAMQAVPRPHQNWKQLLVTGNLRRSHVEQFAVILREIHRATRERRAELEEPFGDSSFFEALRLEPFYSYTAAKLPDAAQFLGRLLEDTRAHRETLVHGDYSPKNVLVHDGRLVLVDHEVVHLGDPAFDLGFSLAHLLSKANHLEQRRGDFATAAQVYWQTYGADPDLERRAVRHTLACLLARVAGRSPLEYLSQAAAARQQQVVLGLISEPPTRIETLVRRFVGAL